jgi:hypothetical protein
MLCTHQIFPSAPSFPETEVCSQEPIFSKSKTSIKEKAELLYRMVSEDALRRGRLIRKV